MNQDLSAMEGRVVLRETRAPAVCPAHLALREHLALLEKRERKAFQDQLDCEEMLAMSVSRELPELEELKEKLGKQEKVGPMANQVKMVKMELRVYAANQVKEEGRGTQAHPDRQGKLEKKGLMVVEVTAENKALKDSLVRLGQLETKDKLVFLGPRVLWAHQANVVAEASMENLVLRVIMGILETLEVLVLKEKRVIAAILDNLGPQGIRDRRGKGVT